MRQWYASPSRYLWRDENGTPHEIAQGDGGEQGDAMIDAGEGTLNIHVLEACRTLVNPRQLSWKAF